MESSYKKIICGILLLIVTVMLFLWYPLFSPEILICWALIIIIIGLFEYKGYSNRFNYWILIFVILTPTLITLYFLLSANYKNALQSYFLIIIFVIISAWYLFRYNFKSNNP